MFICPHCDGRLASDRASFTCPNGHAFDRSREGYVNLTVGRDARKASDTREMVAARERFLEKGHYDPIAVAVSERARSDVVVDVGCGPGYYLERVEARTRVGVDLSKDAIRNAARRLPGAEFAVADVTRRIPLRSRAADVVTSVFAPRPVAEFERVLAPGGRVVVVAAGPQHLREPIEEFGLLSVGEGKEDGVVSALSQTLEVEERASVTYERALRGADVADLIRMGPNYWHTSPETLQEAEETMEMRVTVDVSLVVARAR